jgi:hypothetical protein
MHNKFSCGHTVLENNLRENSSLSYLFTKPTKQVFKFVRTKTETCALKLETIRGPSALSVYMSNLWLRFVVFSFFVHKKVWGLKGGGRVFSCHTVNIKTKNS